MCQTAALFVQRKTGIVMSNYYRYAWILYSIHDDMNLANYDRIPSSRIRLSMAPDDILTSCLTRAISS